MVSENVLIYVILICVILIYIEWIHSYSRPFVDLFEVQQIVEELLVQQYAT